VRKHGAGAVETKVAELQRDVTKFLLNAVFGHISYIGCRIYDPSVMGEMVALARECLTYLRECIIENGYEVIGGDTDGLPVKIPRNEIPALLKKLNNDLLIYAAKRGLGEPFEIKLDWYADKFVFVRKRDKKKGAKKRYCMHLIEKDGKPCDIIVTKGFEVVRGDQSNITRKIQKEAFLSLFNGKLDDFAKNVQETIKKIKNNTMPFDDIAIRMNIGKDPDKYDTNTEYSRGALYGNNNFKFKISQGDRIKMLFVKNIKGYPKTDVICYMDYNKLPKDITIDSDKIIERTIRSKIETILETADWTWDKILGRISVKELFG
jgi:DNA polymerase elongation subunit (family B)